MTYKNIPVLLALLFSVLMGVKAQELRDFTFSHLGTADGMHTQRVYSILQTSDGALWWSTKNGVERYNGVNIKHYLLGDADMYSDYAGKRINLCNHFDKDVKAPDASGILAFDNKGRIFAYNVSHDEFVLKEDICGMLKEQVDLNDILQTAGGYWLATNKGIFFLHDHQLIPVVRKCHANYIIPVNATLLFCTRQGVMEYKQKPKEMPKPNTAMRAIVPYDVESGYYDHVYNKVWLGGYSSGIRILTPKKQGYQEINIGMTHNPVRVFYPYDMHSMLIGIDGMGVYKSARNVSEGTASVNLLFNANDGPHGVLHGNGIYSLIRDFWGNIVIGSYSGGIDIARPVGTTVAIFQHTANNHQSLLNDHVNSVCQSPSGKLLIGTDNGVSIYDPKSERWGHACEGSVVLNLCKTPQGSILAATYGQGVMELTEDGQAHTLYSTANGTLRDDHVYKLLYDREGNLWIGGLDGELTQLTAAGARYYPLHYVKDMLQLPDGRIAVGTTYGITLLTPSNGKREELNYYPKQEKDCNNFVHTMYLNDDRELWIGTDGGGIYVYDLTTGQSRHLTTRNGLPSNYVNSIHKDVLNRIIIATEHGLSFADPKNNDRIIGVNYCYGVDREYTSRSVINLDNGHMVLGSTTGALVVNPNHIQEINYTAKLNLSALVCDEDTDEDWKERVHRQLSDRRLDLSYGQRTFELFFEAINLRNQSDIVYQYKVDGGEWSSPSSQQFIRFTSMEPGKHRLSLRCVSRTCGAELDEISLTIKIGQPWWNTWWMWIIYLFLLAMAFYGAWRVYHLHTKYMRLVVNNPSLNADVVRKGEISHGGPQGTVPGMAAARKPLECTEGEMRDEGGETRDEGGEMRDEGGEMREEEDEGSEFISRATTLIIDNISDSDFTIDCLCREMAMSRTLFYVKLKSYTGKSPQDFIRVIRLERAAALLRNGRPVTDAAALTGFDNPKYFSTVFKKYFGVSPSEFKKSRD